HTRLLPVRDGVGKPSRRAFARLSIYYPAPVDLREKRALVTGATGGVGVELARAFSAAGAHLVLAGRRAPELGALAAELRPHGTAVDVIPGDLCTAAGAEALAEAAGRVDVLVNNASAMVCDTPWKGDLPDEGDRLLQVNLLSPLRLTTRVLGPMVERG